MIINITKFVSVEILMQDMQNFSNSQYLYMNYLSNIPLLTCFAMTCKELFKVLFAEIRRGN